eukprot:jgi/Ulvmu1/4787/UM020_0072.1
MMNTMSKQQGIINCSMTVESALSNRAAWAAHTHSRGNATIHEKRNPRSWPRPLGTPGSVVTGLAHNVAAMVDGKGTASASFGQSPAYVPDVRHRTKSVGPCAAAGLPSYMKPVQARSDSPCRSGASSSRTHSRPFSAGRCKTPGERMRERIESSFDLKSDGQAVLKEQCRASASSAGSLALPLAGRLPCHRPPTPSQYRVRMSARNLYQAQTLIGPNSTIQKKPWNDCANAEIPPW